MENLKLVFQNIQVSDLSKAFEKCQLPTNQIPLAFFNLEKVTVEDLQKAFSKV